MGTTEERVVASETPVDWTSLLLLLLHCCRKIADNDWRSPSIMIFFFSCRCSPWNHCRCWSHRAWWCSEGSKWTPSGSVAPWIWRPGRRSGRGDCPRSHGWWSSGPWSTCLKRIKRSFGQTWLTASIQIEIWRLTRQTGWRKWSLWDEERWRRSSGPWGHGTWWRSGQWPSEV